MISSQETEWAAYSIMASGPTQAPTTYND